MELLLKALPAAEFLSTSVTSAQTRGQETAGSVQFYAREDFTTGISSR
jgi:hypothetical protein